MKQSAKDRLILSFLLFGFAILFIEIRHMHRFVLAEGHTPQAWIPIIMTGVLAFASLLAMFNHRQSQVVAACLFFLGIGTGCLGSYFHSRGEIRQYEAIILNTEVRSDGRGDDHGREPEGPPLAPLSITGLSSIGFIVAAMNRKSGK